jgi:hypothetical protein
VKDRWHNSPVQDAERAHFDEIAAILRDAMEEDTESP